MTKNEQNRVLAWRLKLLHEASAMPRNVAQAIPAEEAVDNGLNSALSAVSPATTLSPPVTLTYSGSSTAFTITDSGTGRAVQASITDAGSFGIAIYGLTSGTGPAVAGYTTGKSALAANSQSATRTVLQRPCSQLPQAPAPRSSAPSPIRAALILPFMDRITGHWCRGDWRRVRSVREWG